MNNLKVYSIMRGLIVPDFLDLDYTRKMQELITRNHRVKDINDITKEYFNIFMDIVEKNEIDLLKALSLPGINKIRADYNKKGVDSPYVAPENYEMKVDNVLGSWFDDIIKDPDVYKRMMTLGLAVGLSDTQKLILEHAPESMTEQIEVNAIYAGTNSEGFITRLLSQGSDRINKKLLVDYKKIIDDTIINGIAENVSYMDIAKTLHRKVGEGAAWDWARFVRSEITLAFGRGYDLQADKQGIIYDMWSATATACKICSPLDGQVWMRGKGPRPVEDTHPNCYCIRIPQFTTEKPVQHDWDAPPVYNKGLKYEIELHQIYHITNKYEKSVKLTTFYDRIRKAV